MATQKFPVGKMSFWFTAKAQRVTSSKTSKRGSLAGSFGSCRKISKRRVRGVVVVIKFVELFDPGPDAIGNLGDLRNARCASKFVV